MGSLSYSLGPFYPIRKIASLMSLKPHKRYTRVPSTLQDCINDPAPKTVFCRPWIVVILILPLLFYFYRVNGMELYRLHSGVIIVKPNNTHAQVLKSSVGDKSRSTEVFDEMIEAIGFDLITTTTKMNFTDVLPHDPPVCVINIAFKPGNLTVDLDVNREAAFVGNSLVGAGGYYKPSTCQARHRVAIIVPYRHREKNLAIFLTHIHKFLINQQIEYRIFVMEQSGQQKFNKGRLFNAGFDQAKDDWDCFVFHDVDLLPLDTRILYTCPSYPRHMSTTVYDGDKIVNFTQFFGGVTAMTEEHLVAVNGYSNRFWGWGGEDNDMFWRIRISNLPIMRYNKDIARYIMLPHERPDTNRKRFQTLNKYSKSLSWLKKDGLATLKYVVVFKKLYSLFTHVIVDINPYKDPVE